MGLTLKPEPDGFRYLYGDYIAETGERYRVDVMPPKSHWRGDILLTDNPPHATDWVVYCNGQELARVRERADLDQLVAKRLAIGTS